MKTSSGLITAFFVAILILPISAIVNSAWSNTPIINPASAFNRVFSSWYGGAFIFCEASLFLLVTYSKNKAMKIYNELYPD